MTAAAGDGKTEGNLHAGAPEDDSGSFLQWQMIDACILTSAF